MNPKLLTLKTVLVVEDNSINQMLVRHTLSACNILTEICDTGTKAIELLKTRCYDLILMDIHLPEIDGYETAVIIRKELKLETPILAMTALLLSGEEDKCFVAGMNGYIPKPFTQSDLQSAILKFLTKDPYKREKMNVASGVGNTIMLP